MDLFIITGITKGLGSSINKILKEKNKYTLSISRNIKESNEDRIIECDLSNLKEVIDLEERFKEIITCKITKIIFINNAGTIAPIYKIGEDIDYEMIVRHITVNYIAPVIMINAIVKLMTKNCKLEIINITTGAAERPLANWALYSSSKKAMKTYFETLEIEDRRVRVAHFDPGVMDTPMQDYIRNKSFPLENKFQEYYDNKVLKNPDDVAKDIIKRYISEL